MKASASVSTKSRRPKGRAPATFAAKSRIGASTLILFDIDGTLVLTGGAGGRAMSLAFAEVFAIANAFDGIPMAGRTDAWILNDAVAAHRLPPDSPDLARFKDAYVRHLAIELEKPGVARKGLMPGVRELLDALAPRDDVYLALLTGNYEAGARLKLEYFDLWKYFSCGAFGDEAPHRNVLVPKALTTVAACGGPAFAAADAIVIGDTPLDVGCAIHAGARSLGVATGSHSVEQLQAAGADAVLKDLSDTDEVLGIIGLRK
jgi:phosphoglycolate phosphatase-like HAD superfamily hydrolase